MKLFSPGLREWTQMLDLIFLGAALVSVVRVLVIPLVIFQVVCGREMVKLENW